MTRRRLIFALCASAGLAGQPPAPAAGAERGSASERLGALLETEWEYRLRESPTFASSLGDRRYNDRWPDLGLEALERRARHHQQVLERLARIPLGRLLPGDRLNHTLFAKALQSEIAEYRLGLHLIPLNQRGGIQTAHELADGLPFETVKDYEDWIARLQAFPTYMDQTIGLLKQAIRRRLVHPKVIARRIPDQIAAQIIDDPTASRFYDPCERFPRTFGGADKQRLEAAAAKAIRERVIPAFEKLHAFFTERYLPAGYDRVGAWQFPDGKAFYAARARHYTTTDLSPARIHEIGRREVARIRGEMDRVIEQVEFKGTFAEFLEFLRTDRQFYYTDGDELLAAYRALSKRIDPSLVKLFRTIPRMPYGVEPIPADIAPDTTTGYYRPPAADGSRAGTYFVNLYRPEMRPTYEMEALSLHEAVPGHHFQIARAMELKDLPAFRRYTGTTAYVEGWALYAESLGDELGLYRDPYAKFGQLTYEMWRAVRLVVDTGMHDLGWTRAAAIGFFKANAAKTEYDIINEIDRYIAWPGQALAYKIGELKFKELRARATQALGERFDLRAFHDCVLEHGAVPLDVLEAVVDEWVASQR